MGKTLILLFHRDISRSKANAALRDAALDIPDVDIIDMQRELRDFRDLREVADREVVRLLEADRIVLQFPIQWYSTPALLKAWEDEVLTRMFYISYEQEGRRLEGTPLMIAATAGNVSDAYRPGGRNMFTTDALLAPLQATANRCGLPWAKPFIVYRSDKLTAEELRNAGSEYAATLTRWIASGNEEREPKR